MNRSQAYDKLQRKDELLNLSEEMFSGKKIRESILLSGEAAKILLSKLQELIASDLAIEGIEIQRLERRQSYSKPKSATILLTIKNQRVKVEISTSSSSYSVEESDPRLFGDSDAVVSNNMRDWYPGKTNSSTTCTAELKAYGISDLPEVCVFRESYSGFSEGKCDALLKAIGDLDRRQVRAKQARSEQELAAVLKNVFK